LNQLGYFDPLRPRTRRPITRDTRTNTVDLLLKVKERGRNSIQLNGGVSGISEASSVFSYSTNNFLGLGETLSLARKSARCRTTLLSDLPSRIYSINDSGRLHSFLYALQL